MRIAFFANNQFLLMTAINLKCTIFATDEIHLYTTFKFFSNIFDKNFFIKDIGVIEESVLDLHNQMRSAYMGADDFLKVSKGIVEIYGENPADYRYDMVVAMGYTCMPFWLTALNRRNGKDTKLVRISDGVIFKYSSLNYHFDKIFKEVKDKSSFIENGFQSELLYNIKGCPKKNHEVIEIPQINKDTKKVVEQMDLLSEYLPSKNPLRHYKYIFFTSSTINGCNFYENENQVIERVARRIGIENLIVCPHPWRNSCDIEAIGVSISHFGWAVEFLYPHINIEEKIFISAGTNAVYTPFEVFGRHPEKVYLLDKIMKEDNFFYKNKKFEFAYYTSLHSRMLGEYQNKFKGIYIDDEIGDIL